MIPEWVFDAFQILLALISWIVVINRHAWTQFTAVAISFGVSQMLYYYFTTHNWIVQ